MTLRDRDQHLVKNWYILALSRELQPEKAIARTLYERHYVAFRDSTGQVGVFEDRCPHRGAKLSEGSCSGSHLRCPYHGWAFNTSGTVVDIPSEGEEFKKPSWKLNKLFHCEQDGVLWVWTGDEPPPSHKAFPSWRFPQSQDSNCSSYFMITDFSDEVTRLAENFMDVPHTVFVHSKWFRTQRRLRVPIEVDVTDQRVLVTYNQSQDRIGFMERVLNPKKKPMIHTDEFISPNITRVDYHFGDSHFIINSQISPIAPFRSRVYTWISYRVGPLTKIIKPFMKFYTRRVIQQDVEIMKNVGDNFQRFSEFSPRSTGADELHLAIERVRELGRLGQRGPAPYNRSRDLWI